MPNIFFARRMIVRGNNRSVSAGRHLRLAQLLVKQDRHAEAEEPCRKAIKLMRTNSAKHGEAMELLKVIFAKLGKTPEDLPVAP